MGRAVPVKRGVSLAASAMRFCPLCAHPLAERAIDSVRRLGCTSSNCSYVFYGNPVPVVAAIVEHEGHVVLARNASWPEGMFGLVAGFVESGESPDAAVTREVREELGLASDRVSLVGLYSFPEMNQLIIAYHVSASGVLKLGDEIAAVKKIPPEKVRPWSFGTGLAVADWLRTRKPGVPG